MPWNGREIRNGEPSHPSFLFLLLESPFRCHHRTLLLPLRVRANRSTHDTIYIAFQTAVALADFRFMQIEDKDENDVPTLDQEDFEEVCDMMIKFKDYLKDLHGKDEDERAHKEFSRGPVFGLDD